MFPQGFERLLAPGRGNLTASSYKAPSVLDGQREGTQYPRTKVTGGYHSVSPGRSQRSAS